MVNKEDIEKILNNIIDITETNKCGGGSNSSGGKKKPKKKPSNDKLKKLFEEFDRDDYSKEEYDDEEYAHPESIEYGWKSPRGRLQKIQHDLQLERNYSSDDLYIMGKWSVEWFRQINSYLFNKPDVEGTQWKGSDTLLSQHGLGPTLKEFTDWLSKAIDKSPRLQEPCVTYKLCPTDVLDKMEVGEGGKFDGFQSTSFNYSVCTKALISQTGGGWIKDGEGYEESNRSIIRYYNMKGTKGVNIGESVDCNDWQSEWLLDKNQPFVSWKKYG